MEKYFDLTQDGIIWRVKPGQAHSDNLEMSAFGASYIVGYGSDEKENLRLARHCVYPTLRTIPNDTHASYQLDIDDGKIPVISVNGVCLAERAEAFELNGILTAYSGTDNGIKLEHIFYPASEGRCNIEKIIIKNPTEEKVELAILQDNTAVHSYGRGTKGVYIMEISHDGARSVTVNSGEAYQFHIYYTARIANEKLELPDGDKELLLRRERVRQLCDPLKLETGNPVLDMMYRFAKIRAGESIFQTEAGLLHSPGGISYYAATWCNDQVEYAGPWFSMTGDGAAINASMNAYRQYIPFMSETYTRIPSSIIAEGHDIWEGAGDRGDAAMYLYGASLFALFLGDSKAAGELWPAIKWCAQYCHRKKSPEGVILSDSDELEGRFPTDKRANLSTSSLCYGGLRLASLLAGSLGEMELGRTYTEWADELEAAIEDYFGATLHGFDTYRYSKGFDTLRAWICLPACMGIDKRLNGTLAAMLSGYLWTEDGMLSCELGEENKSRTIWDRSTLYGFRCAFLSGRGDEIWDAFENYCEKRLLSDRVPYAVEAYPEGDKRHLSAESALFARIITEGILGIAPAGRREFSFQPYLPKALEHLYLTDIHAFGRVFAIYVDKNGYRVLSNGEIISQGGNDKRVTVAFE
jgi:hypothetical protein